MTNLPAVGVLDRLIARLPDGPTVLRIGAIVLAGAIAVWAIGLAITLFLAVLVGSLALAAAIALAGGLLARRKHEVVRAAAADILKREPVRSTD